MKSIDEGCLLKVGYSGSNIAVDMRLPDDPQEMRDLSVTIGASAIGSLARANKLTFAEMCELVLHYTAGMEVEEIKNATTDEIIGWASQEEKADEPVAQQDVARQEPPKKKKKKGDA